MSTTPANELASLLSRLGKGEASSEVEQKIARPPAPIYLLTVDDTGPLSIVLIVRTGGDGVPRATIVLPKWHELAEGWDGPHTMDVAMPLVEGYAHAYGYQAITIDIESPQLWQAELGELQLDG